MPPACYCIKIPSCRKDRFKSSNIMQHPPPAGQDKHKLMPNCHAVRMKKIHTRENKNAAHRKVTNNPV